jgi:hypothetical protein
VVSTASTVLAVLSAVVWAAVQRRRVGPRETPDRVASGYSRPHEEFEQGALLVGAYDAAEEREQGAVGEVFELGAEAGVLDGVEAGVGEGHEGPCGGLAERVDLCALPGGRSHSR